MPYCNSECGNVRSQASISGLVNILEENDIDIARIQETPDGSVSKIQYGNYVIYFG